MRSLLLLLTLVAQPAEVLTEVHVQGNVAITEEEVLRLAAVEIGAAFDADTAAIIEKRLRATGKFQKVEVLKRFASIADPSKISVVIVVEEGDVIIEWDQGSGAAPRTVRRRGPGVMFLPILDVQDGYGWTYGVRFAVPNVAGSRSRIAFPLTWGGDKRAAVQFEKDFDAGPLDRAIVGLSVSRREHPFYERDDDRLRLSGRVERDLLPKVRAGAAFGTEHVRFLADDTRFYQTGADLVLDTRLDPVLARNAVYARAAWDRYAVTGDENYHQYSVDLRGYAGLIGQSVLVGRLHRSASDRPLLPFLQPILGGMDNLRGFEAGSAVGDTLVAGSVEVRTPITSPLNVAKLGVSAFVDVGTVYDHAARVEDQRFGKGIGGSVWLSAAFFRLNFSVAKAVGGGTRVHFGTAFAY